MLDQTLDDPWVNWIRQVARGDETALASFYNASSSLVYGLAFRILGDAHAAEEVTLDVYLQIWRQASRFDSARGRVSTWLLVMTRSRALDNLRARPKELRQSEPLEAVAETRCETAGPEESAVVVQLQARVRRALRALSHEQRWAIELAYFGGLTRNEIALELNEPLGTIKTRIHNGMLKLRKLLLSYEGDRSERTGIERNANFSRRG